MMVKNLGWLVAVATSCLALVLMVVPREGVHAQPANKVQWEYKVVECEELIGEYRPHNGSEKGTKSWNKLAEEGWEYAGVQHVYHAAASSRIEFTVLKRVKK